MRATKSRGTQEGVERAKRSSLAELRHHLDHLEERSPPVLSQLTGEFARLLGTDGDTSYRPDVTTPRTPLAFVHMGGHLQGKEELFRDFLRRTTNPWPVFQPEWIEPSQRNRVLSLDEIVEAQGPASLERNPHYHTLYPRLDIAQSLRALITDGPVLLAWVGVFSPEHHPFRPDQVALLQALVPSLRARLRTERLLGDHRLSLAAFAPMLEAIGAPALLIDAQAHIHHANQAGITWLDDDHVAARTTLRAALRGKAAGVDVTPLSAVGMAPRWLVVVRRHRQLSAARVQHLATRWGLTPRQQQVLALVAEGQANKTIAARLGVAENTVEVHVSALLRKAQVDSRASLIAAFLRDE